ncbi:MAG TPA: ribbon-helix-helix protein, CopG family, partial [Chthoniobacteraceae bacterium]|nr:ribbon-helix-helix protein, CopG family [Chthoniobacteraceae bacterium]
YAGHTMAVLTVRISDEEKARLARRAKESGVSAGALVRRLPNESLLTSADDLLKEMERRMGDRSLRVRRRK